MRRIAVVLVDRANYGRLRPVMEVMKSDPDIDMQLVCTGSMLLDRFGRAVDVVKGDGFEVQEEIYIELEGSVPSTMVKTMGLAIIELANAFHRLAPDLVVIIGDRYEALSAAIASAYQNICLVHIQGGEVTGSIDESTRHAISKIAHYHFPSTTQAAEYLMRMGEMKDTVFPFGCPSADVVSHACQEIPDNLLDKMGVGAHIDTTRRYIIALFHPVTTEYGSGESQMEELLEALRLSKEQVIMIWPNIDAGSDGISQAIRRYREMHRDTTPLHVYKNFEPNVYVPLMKKAACLVGNSSSFIRDASFLGTPVVLVGNRQEGREKSEAVVQVNPIKDEILESIRMQIEHGPYQPSTIYGEAGVSLKIVEQLRQLEAYTQKRLSYCLEGNHEGV